MVVPTVVESDSTKATSPQRGREVVKGASLCAMDPFWEGSGPEIADPRISLNNSKAKYVVYTADRELYQTT